MFLNYNELDAICRSGMIEALTKAAEDRRYFAAARTKGDARVALRCRVAHDGHMFAVRASRSMVRRPLP